MGNKLLYTVGLGAFLAACYLAADLTLKNLLSEERLRVMLIEPVQDQLGRQMEIGSIKASVFSGIEIKDIIVKEKNPAQAFLTIGTFRLNYELLPLLEKRLVIKEVLIDKPTVRIAKDSQGVFNFADLTLAPKQVVKEIPPPELQKAKPLPITLVFDQIKVSNLNLTFSDQSGKLPTITSTTGDLSSSVTLGKTLAEARYRGSLELIVNSEYQAHRLVLLVKGDFDNQRISFTGELNAELDKLFFTGQLANLQASPDLTLDLQSAKLDLDNLLTAQAADKKTSVRSAPTPLASPTSAAPAHGKFRAQGKITVTELRREKLALRNLSLTYTFTDNVLAIPALTAGVFGGTISGKADLDLSHAAPAFRGQLKADKLQLAAAMESLDKPQGYLTGDLSADFTGRGSGGGWPEIRDSLEGQGKFAISKGGMASSPISQALASLLALPELDNLKFDKLSGSLKIAGGQAALDANLSSRAFSMQTKGSIGLNGSLELPLSLKLSPENSQRLQERAAFARYLADPAGRTTLNLKLKGTVDHPDLSLSGEGAGNQIKTALGQRASEELDRALSKNSGGLAGQNQKAAGEISGQLLKQLLGN